MVVVAQLVRALVCGTRGRGFEPRLPPHVLYTTNIQSNIKKLQLKEILEKYYTNHRRTNQKHCL